MSLLEQIDQDIKKAMLAREKQKLEALRGIKAALMLAKSEKTGPGLTKETELRILQKLQKQRLEAAQIYKEQNRVDLQKEEEFQAGVIEAYLPSKLSPEDLKNELEKIIEETGASSPSDMGKVMGVASKKLAGRADGKEMSKLVREMLANH
jgi:hypothetical protein